LSSGIFLNEFVGWRSQFRVGTANLFTGQSPSLFYRSVLDVEYLSAPNHVNQPAEDDPATQVAVLDTLYKVAGIGLPGPTQNFENATMTYFRGGRGGPVLFSGFSIWDCRRSHEQALVDFVLTDLWGLMPRGAQGGPLP